MAAKVPAKAKAAKAKKKPAEDDAAKGIGSDSFKKVSLADRLASFETEINAMEQIQQDSTRINNKETGGNTGEEILAQLFAYIERTMAKVAETFRRIDKDGGGTLDKGEFRQAVALFGFEVPGSVAETLRLPHDWEIDAAFEVLDKDGAFPASSLCTAAPPRSHAPGAHCRQRRHIGRGVHGGHEGAA
eukprot:COSAG04_NODE_686_length_11156_cov_44.791806_12_plen_188_part_00